jgi:hypothetical protein
MAIPVYVPQDKGVQDEGDDSESDLHQNITIRKLQSFVSGSGSGFGFVSEMRIRIQLKNKNEKNLNDALVHSK